jgi:hypothetical protein
MSCISAVRIGPSTDNVSAKVLRNALVSYFILQQIDDAIPSTANATLDEISPTLVISNKYFTATVRLQEPDESPVEHSKEDGIILVFDALCSNPDRSPLSNNSSGRGDGGSASFDSLSFAHQQAEEKEQCGDLLRLCVGVSLSNLSPEELRGKNHEAEYSRRILWCLDNGYEYVEADLSKEGQTKGHSDRDKDGFARVVEAIQGTVWSSAVMSNSKKTELQTSHQASAALVGGVKSDSTATASTHEGLEQDLEEENPYQPPDPSIFGPTLSTTYNALDDKIQDAQVAEGMLLEPEKVGPQEIQELRRQMENEQVFDQMENALREASRVREASKGGLLSDEERRQRAGDAAMALMNLMGKFGMDEEEDEKIQEGDSSSDDDSGVMAD